MILSTTTVRRRTHKPRSHRAIGGAAVLLAVFVGLLFSASSALASAPWWGLTSESWPTNLHSGLARDEVQELTLSATGGHFLLVAKAQGRFFIWDAKHEEVQAGLEEIYGPGNVEVPEGEGDETGSKPYKIIFTKELADRPVPPIAADTSYFGKKILTGGREEATVTERTQGRPDGRIVVTAQNLGDAWVDGRVTPVVLEDTLPEDLEVVNVEAEGGYLHGAFECSSPTPRHVRCVLEPTDLFGEEIPAVLAPYSATRVFIAVKPAGTLSSLANVVNVSGGGAKPATLTKPIRAGASNPFGVADYSMVAEEEGGGVSTQAGAHPFQLSTTVVFDTSEAAADPNRQEPVGMAKDLTFQLPAGLIGNPTPFPQCTEAQFTKEDNFENECPANTALGEVTLSLNINLDGNKELGPGKGAQLTVPVFNLVPVHGEPARFGFDADGVHVYLDTAIRSGGDYGVTVKISNISQIAGFLGSRLTFWGVPGDPAHDISRGWHCGFNPSPGEMTRRCPTGASTPPPFLSLPTSCTGPMPTTLQADSWQEPHPSPTRLSETPLLATYQMDGLGGCNHLPFAPEIRVTPDGTAASSPTGVNVDVHVPQTAVLNAESLAESAVKATTVELPPGVAINPSGGDGLQACSEGQIGYLPPPASEPPESLHFTPTLPEPFCSMASKIGTVRISTPLLPKGQDLTGAVYLASQNENPFGSLIAAYVVVEDPVSGTLVKLPGEVRLCEGPGEVIEGMRCQAPGQLVATFKNTPQLAFEDAVLEFFGGERAPLASPPHCGPYTTNATFVPWSVEPGEAPHTSSSTFGITEGPNHTPCPGAQLPFSPSLTGGATNLNAGAFSPFTLTMTRKDGEQNLQSLEVHLPPGLSGVLSNIELCPEPQANEGKCAPNSLIGETTVSVGVGGDPFSVSGGKFYLTGPYNGTGSCKVTEPGCAPFGLTFEVPAKAGPFDLKRNSANPAGEDACDCVIVRGKIEINPLTAALTITSDPPGSPYAIPTSIEGIPLEIQHVNAITTRGNFQFNPTNCSKMEVTGTIHSSEGATDTIGVPFQVTNCGALKFTPKFQVFTNAKTSKARGASLTTKVSEPAGSLGTQTNLARVKVELPKQLPSRLTTLQKACTSKQFEANPAACPPASKIGYAKVITPLVPVPLEGPAIFVSHGGEAFPSLTMVLQGYGVTIDLVGTTFISKAGVTSTTFKTVPDQPFNSFQLTLPTGKYSALTANGNLCKVKGGLKMPTEFIAQNGAEIKQSTKITVTGCKTKKKAHKARHRGKRAGHRAKGRR
jgi:hypothetical protein